MWSPRSSRCRRSETSCGLGCEVIPLAGFGQEPMMTSLAQGDVFLPSGSPAWCPGLSEAPESASALQCLRQETASALLAHKGVRAAGLY